MHIKAIRGMHDILPEDIPYWQLIEASIRRLTRCYGYREIRFPIVEEKILFKRTIGEVTDIVEKEMYEFTDRNGVELALRPEGTAGCVRACIEHGLLYNTTQRLWYMGPMFRHERPQKGRYRQFYQFGMEAFGFIGPDIDAEMILWIDKLLQTLHLRNGLVLNINSIGIPEERLQYRQHLIDYFSKYSDVLDEESKRRLHTNPMRILDSKNPLMAECIANAPSITSFLGADSRYHFDSLCQLLDTLNIHYILNPRLVRGLDYYTNTVFEWTTDVLGAQGTVCAGGRYNGLVSLLGGQDTPAVGFAIGLERLIELMKINQPVLTQTIDGYLISLGEKAEQQAFLIAEKIREQCPHLSFIVHCGKGSLKRQFKAADKSGAHFALILGEDEINKNLITIKFLREDKPQKTLTLVELLKFLEK